MDDEESVRSERKKKSIVAVAFIAIAAGILWYHYRPEIHLSTSRAFFTDDDGKTWYADSLDMIPPYVHNGREAVRINVYRTERNPTPFAGYLTKFPPEMKEAIELQSQSQTPPTPPHQIAYRGEMPNRMLVKVPGDGAWESMQSPEGLSAMTVTSPDMTPLDSVVPTD